MEGILIILIFVLVLVVIIFVVRIVIVLVVLCDLCCRLENVIVTVGGVVRLSARRLLHALAEAVLVRVVLVRISVAHLG